MEQIWLRKIARELATQRSRTALTVISIAVGLFAVSLTFRTQAILAQNVAGAYADTRPAAIIVQIEPADAQIIDTLRRIPGVAAVEGLQRISARARVGGTWRALALTGVDDLAHMQVSRVAPGSGAWPAPRRAMLLEQSYLADGARVGDTLQIEVEKGRTYQLPIAGAPHDMATISGRLGSPVLQGYVSLDTAAWLSGTRAINELQIAVAGDQADTARRQEVASQVRARLRAAGSSITHLRLRDPQMPETYAIITAVFQTLSLLGLLSLGLSACLVVNTISAMLARQVPQIGVMKAIGARTRSIFTIYLTVVLMFAALGMLLALPAAALGAWLLSTQLAWLLNYEISDLHVPLQVILIEIGAGMVTPLLASLYPVAAAAQITVREALGGTRAEPFGAGLLGRALGVVRGAPIALLYAARSMFRRKARLALTLAALSCGGAIAMTVASAQASLFATLDQVADYWQQDLTVSFSQPQRAARAIGEAQQVAGVVSVESQAATLVSRLRPGRQTSEEQYAIYGVQPDSPLLAPTLVAGRWLEHDDQSAIVVNVDFLKHEPGLQLGDQLTLTLDERTTSWQIVGVVTSHLLIYGSSTPGQGVGYVSAASFTERLAQALRTNRIIITTDQHDAAAQTRIGRALEAHFAGVSIQALVQTQSDIRSQITSFVSLLIVLLLAMALAFIAIGALSLIGAMSLNVLERTKEVGILRVIGASHRQVTLVVVFEGACVGVLSWVPATLLALPLSRLLSDLIGQSIVSWPLVYVFPASAPALWLGLVVALAAGASYLPARRAAQTNVRDALDYV